MHSQPLFNCYQTVRNLPHTDGLHHLHCLIMAKCKQVPGYIVIDCAYFTTPQHCWQQQEWSDWCPGGVINIDLDQWIIRDDPSSQSLIREEGVREVKQITVGEYIYPDKPVVALLIIKAWFSLENCVRVNTNYLRWYYKCHKMRGDIIIHF